jgi:hypothetical protein
VAHPKSRESNTMELPPSLISKAHRRRATTERQELGESEE